MNKTLRGILFSCLLLIIACTSEDDIIQNSINIYPEINLDYFNASDSMSVSLYFHSINSFGQSIKLIDEPDIFFNDSNMVFNPLEGSYQFNTLEIPDSNVISWYHDEDFYRVELDMNTFTPKLNNSSLNLDQKDSLTWTDKGLEQMEYISFYASDKDKIQYHFHDNLNSNKMLIDSSQFYKFHEDSVIYIRAFRVKQFSFQLDRYRGSEGSTRIHADTIFTTY